MLLKIKPFKQSSGLCGPAVLKMVFDFYGLKKTEKQLANELKCDPRYGIPAEPMLKLAKKYGLKGFIKDFSEIEDIRGWVVNKKTPVIVDWFSENEGHYSVIIDIDNQKIFLQDPEIGKVRKIDLETFKRVWFDFEGPFIGSKKDLILRRMLLIYK
mgnify:CR=1 FL=1